MEVDKHELEAIHKALSHWEEKGMLPAGKKEELSKDLRLKKTERQQIAQYFFIVAISCGVLAFGAIFIDDKILEKLKVYFSLSNMFISIACTLPAIAWIYYVHRLRSKISANTYEVYVTAGALLLQIALIYVCKDIGYGHSYNGLLFVSSCILFVQSVLMGSRILWLGALLALMAWFAAFTTWQSNDYHFLGMNYPVRMAIFGLLLCAASFLQKRYTAISNRQRITYITGLLLFFTGMWMVSIFGNFAHLDEWAKVRQTQVIIYAVIFGLCSLLAVYLGMKWKDDVTRDVGVLFLLLNLYSRYFEFFWDNTNKGIFFLILAGSFYLVGRWLNKRRKTEQVQIQ